MNRHDRLTAITSLLKNLTPPAQLLIVPLVLIVCLGGNLANLVEFALIQPLSVAFEYLKTRLRAYPFVEQRTGPQVHLVGDRRSWRAGWNFYPFPEPRPENNAQVKLTAVVCMTIVMITAMLLADHGQLSALLFVPVYGLFAMLVLMARSRRLSR